MAVEIVYSSTDAADDRAVKRKSISPRVLASIRSLLVWFAILVWMTALSGVLLGCREDSVECLPEELTDAAPRERVVQRTLILEYRAGDWKPARVLKTLRWADKARHRTASGTVEIYDGESDRPYASAPADGPAFFEASLFPSVSFAGSTRNLREAHDQVLEGATIPLELPAISGTDLLARKAPRRVRWVSALSAENEADALLGEILSADEWPRDRNGGLAGREYHFDLTGVPELAMDASDSNRDWNESPEGVRSYLPFEVVHWSGDPRSRLNLVLLPDGYTESELHLYRDKAARIVDELFENEPYRTYRGLINVIRLDTASRESGVTCDDGTRTFRNNRYGSSFPVACINAILGTRFNDRFTYQLNTNRVIQDARAIFHRGLSITDEIYVISRSDKFGGTAISWGTQTDGTPSVVASHEMGHSWGGLADEYLVKGDLCHFYMMFASNMSLRKGKPSNVKWKNWIAPELPFPTPEDAAYAGKVGFFQGAAGGCKELLFRPQYECKMRTSGEEFCPVCKEQMILRIFDRASLVEGGLRRDGDRVTAKVFSPDRLFTRWYVNGKKVQEGSGFMPLTGLAPGRQNVRLEVMDLDAPVRRKRCDLATRIEARI